MSALHKVIIVMWLVCGRAIAAEKQPNIIVVLTDDQGYADLGSQGVVKDIRTPYLDRLATEGVRFTQPLFSRSPNRSLAPHAHQPGKANS